MTDFDKILITNLKIQYQDEHFDRLLRPGSKHVLLNPISCKRYFELRENNPFGRACPEALEGLCMTALAKYSFSRHSSYYKKPSCLVVLLVYVLADFGLLLLASLPTAHHGM